jgi:hypothetical protein
MSEVGLFLSSEEHGPRDLVNQAQVGEEAGFVISDHFHLWVDSQGESPFVCHNQSGFDDLFWSELRPRLAL